MIYYKTEQEIEKIKNAAQLVSRTLGLVGSYIEPGITTLKLDKIAEEFGVCKSTIDKIINKINWRHI